GYTVQSEIICRKGEECHCRGIQIIGICIHQRTKHRWKDELHEELR
ncbi:hypothetical protein CFC21_084586, partial [Triticum aestivum]